MKSVCQALFMRFVLVFLLRRNYSYVNIRYNHESEETVCRHK